MPQRPDFTKVQRQRLERLGCEPEQIAQLRSALAAIRRTLYRRAARNDVKASLETVAKHADALLKELGRIAMQTDPARAAANLIIEEAYWRAFPDDQGPWSAHHMLPRLREIAEGARTGIKKLPVGPTRNRPADPHPIARIDNALLYGWGKVHVHVHHVREDTPAEWAAHAKSYPPAGPYPKRFDASDAAPRKDGSGNVFREIVGICYEAAGAKPDADPLRAIRAYLKLKKEKHAEALARLNEVLNAPVHAPIPRRKNRTSKKS